MAGRFANYPPERGGYWLIADELAARVSIESCIQGPVKGRFNQLADQPLRTPGSRLAPLRITAGEVAFGDASLLVRVLVYVV